MSEVEKKAEAYASACVDNPRDQLDTPSEMRYHAYLAGYLEATQDAASVLARMAVNEADSADRVLSGYIEACEEGGKEIRALAEKGKDL